MAERDAVYRAELLDLLISTEPLPTTGLIHAMGQVMVGPLAGDPEKVAEFAMAALQQLATGQAISEGRAFQDAETPTISTVTSKDTREHEGALGSLFIVSGITQPGQEVALQEYMSTKVPNALALAASMQSRQYAEAQPLNAATYPGYERVPLVPNLVTAPAT